MLPAKLETLINEQINFEFYSSYLYLGMSAQFKSENLAGMANWMQIQAQEELCHTMGFYNFLIQRGGRIVLKDVKGPPAKWKSALEIFESAYKHEMLVTARINNIADMASKEKDFATLNFIQWYIGEQVEEEANSSEIVNKLKMIGEAKSQIFMIDAELAKRVFVLPMIPGGGLAAAAP